MLKFLCDKINRDARSLLFSIIMRGQQATVLPPDRPSAQHSDKTLESISNAAFTSSDTGMQLDRKDLRTPIEITCSKCQAVGIHREHDQWWVLPVGQAKSEIDANSSVWILPTDAHSEARAWHLEFHGGNAHLSRTESGLHVLVNADRVIATEAEARPHSDPFGNRFSLQIPGGRELEDALAGFYWGTMLPSVVEKTMAAKFPYSNGYVLSTLSTDAYAGSYPAVDHEFQIKGRLAMGSEADLDVVRRMIELQFKLMDDDPEHLSRAPTSVQPNGSREYHVRRSSMDNKQNAAMFPITANIEVIEEAWHYYQTKKDKTWLSNHIGNLERAAAWTLANTDRYDRVWSDVYYEDQVIEDGRVTQAQAFAANSFKLLAEMETALGRQAKAITYTATSKKLAQALILPLPNGYWDEGSHRYTDWVDRDGKPHDHIHLLANTVPVTFGYATPQQATAVRSLIEEHSTQFERFPSFVAADIAGYTNSEIGNGGPYDLCAAGRYWYWDAAYRESQRQNAMLFDQLETVAAEGAKDNYFMGERYDMDCIYYKDGKDAHGAGKYYEYPNVYAAVLISKYLGLTVSTDADLSVSPHLDKQGTIEFRIPEYALRYTYDKDGFTLKNLSGKRRRIKVDLSALGGSVTHYHRLVPPGHMSSSTSTIELSPQEEARWIALP